MHIRQGNIADLAAIRSLVSVLPPLDMHSAFSYWVLLQYSPELFLVLESEDHTQLLGFVSGVVSASEADVCYLWQLGIVPQVRGGGQALQLLDAFYGAAIQLGRNRVQFSIAPDNIPSLTTAKYFAERNGLVIYECGEVSFSDPITGESTYEKRFEVRRCDGRAGQ